MGASVMNGNGPAATGDVIRLLWSLDGESWERITEAMGESYAVGRRKAIGMGFYKRRAGGTYAGSWSRGPCIDCHVSFVADELDDERRCEVCDMLREEEDDAVQASMAAFVTEPPKPNGVAIDLEWERKQSLARMRCPDRRRRLEPCRFVGRDGAPIGKHRMTDARGRR